VVSGRTDTDGDDAGLRIAEVIAPMALRLEESKGIPQLARIILTSLGAAGEQLGLDAKLRANTEKTKRTHALITQGRLYAVGIGVFAAVAPVLLGAMHGILGSLATATHTIGFI
jgi:hypothetical protein